MSSYKVGLGITLVVTIDDVDTEEDAVDRVKADCEEALAKLPHAVDVDSIEVEGVEDADDPDDEDEDEDE